MRSEEAHSQDERRVKQLDIQEQPDMCEAEVSIPLANHTVTSLQNLITMIYSRGPLLSKATGGSFSCSAELISGLKDCITVEDVVESLSPDLTGLSVAADKIDFIFPYTEDAENQPAQQYRIFSCKTEFHKLF